MKLMHQRDPKLAALAQVDLFRACTRRELAQIAALADLLEVPAGAVLTREGQPGREAFVIAEGRAHVTLKGRRVAELGPGAFFGEMSLLDRGPRSATVQATTDMTLFVLDARSFSGMLQQSPSVMRKMLQTVARRLRVFEEAM